MTISSMRSKSSFHVLPLVLLFLLLARLTKSSVVDKFACIEEERIALLQFKQGLSDPSSMLSSWLREEDCCKWKGIGCNNQTGNVIKLDLSNDQDACVRNSKACLSGKLNPSLFNLTYLQILDLSANWISGPIPTSIENLSKLQTLDLSHNLISGSVPASIGHLLSLELLQLSGNLISGPLPTSIGNLSLLGYLDLSFNMINASIPESIGQLTQLYNLNLLANPWKGVIGERHFQNLTRLLLFKLSSTSLVFNVSPEWIPPFNYSSITIRDCQLATPAFPAWLRSQFIVYIILSNVGISDVIPDWFWGNAPHLAWLDLSSNQLRGKLPDLQNMSAGYVNLNNNLLEGSLPLWSTASYLRLANNRFSGPIPLNFGQEMTQVALLDISRNDLNGSIPISITKMTDLQSLDLSRNHFSGTIPMDWNNSSLETIDFSNNNLSGQIPPSLCSGLGWLRLSNNNLTGELASSLKNCAVMLALDLGGNKLSGTIPTWIGENLQSLHFLLIGANELTGSIPQQLCSLSLLHVLDLSHNHLSGPVPRCLGHLKQLTHSGNMLQSFPSLRDAPDMDSWHIDLDPKGVQYEYTTLLTLVNTIDLSSNNLSGEIPEELRNLSKLGSLNLSRNQLTGTIPEAIGSLERLETLDLSGNHLWGSIPISMTSLTLLSKLNLSYNNFSGPIPSTNQFQTFNDPTLFEGNLGLCGPPLPNQCSSYNKGDPEVKENAVDDEDRTEKIWLYASVTLGFIVGFWASFGSLIINRSQRHAYFHFVDKMKDNLRLLITEKCIACVRRNIIEREGQL